MYSHQCFYHTLYIRNQSRQRRTLKKERHTRTTRLYRDSANICNFLLTMGTTTLITLIMMMMTRTIILLLITIVNLIILDIAVIVRAEVSSHNNTSHIGLTSTPHDTLNSINYNSIDTILTFTPILVFLSSFRHKVLFLYLVHTLLLSFYHFIEYVILVLNYLCSSELSLPLQIIVYVVFLFMTDLTIYVFAKDLMFYSSTPCNLSW